MDQTSEDCLYLDIWAPADIKEDIWTFVYFCDGYLSLNGISQTEWSNTKCRNWMGYFTEDHNVISVHINYRYSTHALIDTICSEKNVSIRDNFRL